MDRENSEDLRLQLQRIKIKIKDKGIKLGTPLSEVEVKNLETTYSIKFPENYRLFLLEVGISIWDSNLANSVKDGRDFIQSLLDEGEIHGLDKKLALSRMKEPFPLNSLFHTQYDQDYYVKCWEESFGKLKEGPENIGNVFWEIIIPELLDYFYRGFLPIEYLGCGDYWVLIISGEEKGYMWNFTDVAYSRCYPRKTFLTWLENRLSEPNISKWAFKGYKWDAEVDKYYINQVIKEYSIFKTGYK